MVGTLLVLLIVSFVLLIWMIGVIFDRIDQHKQEDLRRKRESAQRCSAIVVSSAQFKIDWLASIHHWVARRDPDNYYLWVEWTDPETQNLVTSPTRVMPCPCPFHPGDSVFIYVHPALKEVWLDTPHQHPASSHMRGFLT